MMLVFGGWAFWNNHHIATSICLVSQVSFIFAFFTAVNIWKSPHSLLLLQAYWLKKRVDFGIVQRIDFSAAHKKNDLIVMWQHYHTTLTVKCTHRPSAYAVLTLLWCKSITTPYLPYHTYFTSHISYLQYKCTFRPSIYAIYKDLNHIIHATVILQPLHLIQQSEDDDEYSTTHSQLLILR